MSKKTPIALVMAVTAFGFVAAASSSAMAYSCGAEFKAAKELIKEAQSHVTKDTDSRVLGLIAEARGIAEAGIVSHSKASQNHKGDVGKFMHSDSVRKGRWAQNLASQAIFLQTGEER